MSAPLALHDTATARMIDAQATTLLGGDGFVLMQRAGAAAWQWLQARWPPARRLVVVCGTGNNGGDGYVLATLARLSGAAVRVVHLPEHGPESALAQRACTDFLARGGHVDLYPCALDEADVIVDALFGIGLNRAPDAPTAALIEAINRAGVPVFALDVPSGIDAEHGTRPGVAVRATATLQFIVPHLGLHTGDALEHVGERALAGLDVPASAIDAMRPRAESWPAEQLASGLAPRRRNTHKGESGHVLCVGGNEGSGWISRLGLRTYRNWVTDDGQRLQPYLTLNWWHDNVDNVLAFNQVVLKDLYPKDRYEAKAGINIQVSHGWTAWTNLGYQWGNQSYRATVVRLGGKYTW